MSLGKSTQSLEKPAQSPENPAQSPSTSAQSPEKVAQSPEQEGTSLEQGMEAMTSQPKPTDEEFEALEFMLSDRVLRAAVEQTPRPIRTPLGAHPVPASGRCRPHRCARASRRSRRLRIDEVSNSRKYLNPIAPAQIWNGLDTDM